MKKYLITALLFLSLCGRAFCQIDNLQKVQVTDFFGGMDSNNYADKLPAGQGAQVLNADISSKGIISSRKGQSLFNSDVNGSAFTGIGRFDPQASTSYLVIASGATVARSLSSDSTWTRINTGYNLTSGHDTSFVQANDLLFVLNGFDNTPYYNGSSWFPGASWPSSPPTATTGAWLNNYLFLAGNPTHPDWLFVSSNVLISGPAVFGASDVVKINTGDGQAIKKIEPYRTSNLIIYKSRSIYDFDMSNVDSSCSPQPTCQWSYSPITKDVGTDSPKSVVSLGNDQWFLSSNPYGVRSLQRSAFDKMFVNLISQPIKDVFDGTGETTINTVQISKAAAVYFDNKYILAVPTGNSSVNNFVVVYDFITQSWYEITGWYPAAWQVYNDNLYYTDANTGRVIQCFSGTTGDYGTASSASGPTVAVDFVYVSKIFDFDQIENYKQLDSITLEVAPTGDYSATLYLNFDGGGWQNAGTFNLSGTSVTLPATLPFTLQPSGTKYTTLQLSRYNEFKKIQVKVELNSLSQQITLQKISIMARVKPWRRE